MAGKFSIDSKLDLREFKKLIKKLEVIETWEAQAGFSPNDTHPRSEESAAFIATINNYGGIQYSEILQTDVTIPARPFMTFANNYTLNLNNVMAAQFTKFIYGSINSQQALRPIATQLKLNIEYSLSSEVASNWVENRPLTIALKDSYQPLYETGWLIDHVKTWVRKDKKDG